MTLAKKSTRIIEVKGRSYRWLIRRKPTYWEAIGESELHAIVELAETPASVLTIIFDCLRNDNWLSETKYEVRPAHISDAIAKAIEDGWAPEQNRSNHKVEYEITQ